MEDTKAVTIELNGQYGVFVDFDNISSTAEELVTIAHEAGHCMTGATHKICSPYDLIERHETESVEMGYSSYDYQRRTADGVR